MNIEEFKKQHSIVGNSKEINDLVETIMHIAPSETSVLIYGETGTGKEIFANAIHSASRRAKQRLISVNCGAIPEGLLESELFGHKRGSFTGASDNRKGYFELADGGTLFLDEIGEMPITTQVKFLRAIELKEFMPVGAETVTRVDVRYIAATNKSLQEEVLNKRFRQDLFFRLKAVTLFLPPLRDRKEDIIELANFFLEQVALKNKYAKFHLTPEAHQLLLDHDWPGNVRELKSIIETATALARSPSIGAAELSPLIHPRGYSSTSRFSLVPTRKTPEELDREMILRALFELKKDILDLKNLVGNSIPVKESIRVQEIKQIDVLEKEAIINAMERTNGNKRAVARLLGLSERTLYRKIKEYDIPL